MSSRDKLVCIHLFIFSTMLIVGIIWSFTNRRAPYPDETAEHFCKIQIVSFVNVEILYATDFLMLCLLIYIAEKTTATPLQDFW